MLQQRLRRAPPSTSKSTSSPSLSAAGDSASSFALLASPADVAYVRTRRAAGGDVDASASFPLVTHGRGGQGPASAHAHVHRAGRGCARAPARVAAIGGRDGAARARAQSLTLRGTRAGGGEQVASGGTEVARSVRVRGACPPPAAAAAACCCCCSICTARQMSRTRRGLPSGEGQ